MQGDVSMKFHGETFAKGFIDNGILVGLVRYFTTEGHLINITDISATTSNIFYHDYFFKKNLHIIMNMYGMTLFI